MNTKSFVRFGAVCVALAIAAGPVLAQRGGGGGGRGGGGGGGGGRGGGGGGAHVSGGSMGRMSGGSMGRMSGGSWGHVPGGNFNPNFHNNRFHNGSNVFIGVGFGGWWGGYGGWSDGYGGWGGYPYYGPTSFDPSYYASYRPNYYMNGVEPDNGNGTSYQAGAGPGDFDPYAAHFMVIVSNPNAQVLFDKNPTQQQGTTRLFVTPSLPINRESRYTISASWTENGQTVNRERRVSVLPGARMVVDFTEPKR
jgi:uncharacterized protein (TIGR03000 family)